MCELPRACGRVIPTRVAIIYAEAMKVSVSLPEDDIRFLDDFAADRGLDSRSAALQRAVRLLRAMSLSEDYAAAWAEWNSSADSSLWDSVVGDGLGS